MFCISTCALYVHTQQNALCHAHLPSVTKSLNYDLGVREKKKNQNEYSHSHCSLQSPGFESLNCQSTELYFVSLPIRNNGELNLG